EAGERFAQGRAGDAQTGRLLDLAQHGARREPPLQDLAPEGLVCAITRASRRHRHSLMYTMEPGYATDRTEKPPLVYKRGLSSVWLGRFSRRPHVENAGALARHPRHPEPHTPDTPGFSCIFDNEGYLATAKPASQPIFSPAASVNCRKPTPSSSRARLSEPASSAFRPPSRTKPITASFAPWSSPATSTVVVALPTDPVARVAAKFVLKAFTTRAPGT